MPGARGKFEQGIFRHAIRLRSHMWLSFLKKMSFAPCVATMNEEEEKTQDNEQIQQKTLNKDVSFISDDDKSEPKKPKKNNQHDATDQYKSIGGSAPFIGILVVSS